MSKDYEDEYLDDLQEYQIQELLEKADKVVLTAAAAAGATGAVPIPFADAPLLIGEQVTMMVAINAVFGFKVKKDALKSLVTAVLGVSGATFLGKTIAANLIKMIPGAGSVVGGVVSGGTAGVLTLALGKAYIQVCKAIKMGKLDLNDLTKKSGKELLKKEFKKQLQKKDELQKTTKQMQTGQEPSPASSPQDIGLVDVLLVEDECDKVTLVKAIREATGLGLAEAKALAEAVPCTVKENASGQEAERIKAILEAAGATVEFTAV